MKKPFKLLLIILLATSMFVCGLCGCGNKANPSPDNPTDTETGSDNKEDEQPDNKPEDKPEDKPNDNTGDDNPDDNPDDKPEEKPDVTPETGWAAVSTLTTVYYTDSERWGAVYAYAWNNSTGANKASWPGERLTSCGTSDYGEAQYSISLDYSVYDRIIFNNGSDAKKTKDLVVSAAVSGYYGTDGAFTYGDNDYGKVEYFTLTDTQNLNYISTNSKKIAVYTPGNYTPDKKFGVLYMFDSQNLFIAADGAENPHDSYGSWAVDVAVNNVVKHGGEGVIVVAIDTTDGHRDSELTMSSQFGTLTSLADNNDFYNGKLDELGNFIKETLMPWVAANYSVDSSRAKTGIAGSSSGGIAAYYLGLRDNGVYGYIGAFSPANGLFGADSWASFYATKNSFAEGKPLIYTYCGIHDYGLEDMLVPAARQIKTQLLSYGYTDAEITENYVERGTHSENYWRIAFMEFLGKMTTANA